MVPFFGPPCMVLALDEPAKRLASRE